MEGRCKECEKETLYVSIRKGKNGFISIHVECTYCMTTIMKRVEEI